MKKTTLLVVFHFIFISVILVSCETINNVDRVAYEKTISQEEEEMAEQLLTSDELLRFINENQHQKNVDISVDDLKGIDIDDFIKSNQISMGYVKIIGLKHVLEKYRETLNLKVLEPFIAYEIKSIDSTGDEYKRFKEEFFKKAGLKGELLHTDIFEIDHFDIIIGEKNHRIRIGQTKNLDNIDIEKNNFGVYCVTYVLDSSGFKNWAPIYYSKNAKYFILGTMQNEFENDLIKVFCEIDD